MATPCIVNYYTYGEHSNYYVFNNTGLQKDFESVLITQLVFNSLFIIVNPKDIIKWLKRKCIKRYPLEFTQREANDIYELTEAEYMEYYGDINATFATCLFVSPIIPFAP